MKKYILILILAFVCQLSYAQTFNTKNKPIEIVVPQGPGGNASNQAQLVAEILNDYGWSAFVVNKGGADQVIGTNYAAKAKPDGYTLLLGSSASITGNVVFNAPGIEYTENSFVPIVLTNKLSVVIAVPYNSPIKNYEQLKFYMKSNPNKFVMGTFNSKYSSVFKFIATKEGFPDVIPVPYKGSSQLVVDLVGDNIPLAFDLYTAPMRPMLFANKARVIAVLDNANIKEIQALTPNEHITDLSRKYPDLEFSYWNGLFAPAGTPEPIIAEINRVINDAIRTPKYREKLKIANYNGTGGTPEKLGQIVQRDLINLRKFSAQQ
jgi:tripartite-type tricarboxylate transporter receptor subunit TctC